MYFPNINLRLAPFNQLFILSRMSHLLKLHRLHLLKQNFLITLSSGSVCTSWLNKYEFRTLILKIFLSRSAFLTIKITINSEKHNILFHYFQLHVSASNAIVRLKTIIYIYSLYGIEISKPQILFGFNKTRVWTALF